LHPDKLVFFDEVGESISRKGDCKAGGHKFMVARGMCAQVSNSFRDIHFAVVGFVKAGGYPIMCTIIIAQS
jgi:hypothetical protein